VAKRYRLLFEAFFEAFFFVDFLAVFLAAIKWLLRVRRPVVRPLVRSWTPEIERAVGCDLESESRSLRRATSCVTLSTCVIQPTWAMFRQGELANLRRIFRLRGLGENRSRADSRPLSPSIQAG
jgi:hypothetical protein